MSRGDMRLIEAAQVLAGIADPEARVLGARAVALVSELDACELAELAGRMAAGEQVEVRGAVLAPQGWLFGSGIEYARVG